MKTGLQDLGRRQLYQEYLRRIDGRAILEYYGAANCTEQSGSEGTTEIVMSCLLDRAEPHHSNGDANPSACLNLDRKLYVCYSNGWGGDLLHLIAKLEGKETLTEALPMIGEFLEGAVSDDNTFRTELDKLLAEPGGQLIELPSYHERVLQPWALIHPYLYEERGITIEAATKLQLGYDERENRIVFPVFWDGKLIGWQKRVIPARPGWPGTYPDWPKYRNSGGMPKSEVLYGYDEAKRVKSRQVVVVESPMSVAKALSLWIGIPVLATFGAKVSQTQIDLLRDFDYVTVWFDADPAGRAGERKLVEGLYRHTDVQVVLPERGKDLGDYHTQDEVLSMLDGAVPAALRLGDYGGRH